MQVVSLNSTALLGLLLSNSGGVYLPRCVHRIDTVDDLSRVVAKIHAGRGQRQHTGNENYCNSHLVDCVGLERKHTQNSVTVVTKITNQAMSEIPGPQHSIYRKEKLNSLPKTLLQESFGDNEIFHQGYHKNTVSFQTDAGSASLH